MPYACIIYQRTFRQHPQEHKVCITKGCVLHVHANMLTRHNFGIINAYLRHITPEFWPGADAALARDAALGPSHEVYNVNNAC